MDIVKTYLKKGKQFQTENDLEQAIEQYNLALQLEPNCIPAIHQLSIIYEKRKNYQQAIEYLHRLVECQANEANINEVKILERLAKNYIKLGKIFEQQEQKEKAADCYLKALKINKIPVKQTTYGRPISEGMPKPYQGRDIEIIDYQIFPIKDEKRNKIFGFRGPKPPSLEKNTYFTGLGPATTLGCYTQKPYLSLLGERLGLPNLNLGLPGCGATLLNQEDNGILIDLANNSRFVIVLVMSGRSHPSRLFRPVRVGTLVSAQIMTELKKYFKNDQAMLRDVVADMRNSFVEDNIQLVNKLKVPKILLYLSHHPLDYEDDYDHKFTNLNQGFPHFINRETVDRVINYFDDYVECHSSRGYPQKLISRFTGEPVTNKQGEYNVSYASPEMHEDAAKLLLPVCQKYL